MYRFVRKSILRYCTRKLQFWKTWWAIKFQGYSRTDPKKSMALRFGRLRRHRRHQSYSSLVWDGLSLPSWGQLEHNLHIFWDEAAVFSMNFQLFFWQKLVPSPFAVWIQRRYFHWLRLGPWTASLGCCERQGRRQDDAWPGAAAPWQCGGDGRVAIGRCLRGQGFDGSSLWQTIWISGGQSLVVSAGLDGVGAGATCWRPRGTVDQPTESSGHAGGAEWQLGGGTPEEFPTLCEDGRLYLCPAEGRQSRRRLLWVGWLWRSCQIWWSHRALCVGRWFNLAWAVG